MHDVVVIGGGAGGYACAIRAAQLGGKVALVESGTIGGTCVNRGCIPSKVWLHAVNLIASIRSAEQFGVPATIGDPQCKAIVERKNGVANDIRMGMEGLLSNNGVAVVRGRAQLRNAREVDVEGNVLETKKIIIATGSSLTIPDIPGLGSAALTTDQVLDMEEAPASVLIWGSPGPIEVEMAALLNTFGSRVFLASESRRILPREDGDTSQRLAQGLREQGVELLPRCTLSSVKESGGGFEAVLSGAEERIVEVERVLISARKPNSCDLGLEETGVQLNDDASIKVNERLESSVADIYAIGDVTGGWMLSQAASSMAVVAAENAMGDAGRFPFHLIPRGIWTNPEVGAVGLSEEEAEQQGKDVEVGDFPFSVNGLAMLRDEMGGAVKVVSDARFGEILGVHIVGPGATDLIGEAVLAMQLEARVHELARSIRVHPTFSESVVDAARDAKGWALYLPRR